VTDNLVVLLTAFNIEYTAVRQMLTNVRVHRHKRGTRFEVGTVSGSQCQLALGLTGKGNNPAAVLAERAIQEFSPVAVVFVGVAGALWDATPLGDVVMATHVYAYHGGTSEDDGLKARPRSWEASHEIAQIAAHLDRAGDWVNRVPPGADRPRVHFGAVAAGEIVQNSRISHEAKWIREHYNDALAIEMEAAGVAQAGHLSGAPVAIVRGISDRADGTKGSASDKTAQPRAATNAAAFAVRLAEELIKERGYITVNGDTGTRAGTGVSNFAAGQVGIQAGQVTNSTVYQGTPAPVLLPADLVAELAAFRDHLALARAAGSLDEVTFDAACSEIDIASQALVSKSPEGKRSFVVALKRLRGLIADVADLATKIVSLISAAKGL
jgi:nucleoside phosphorylase